MLKFVLLLLLYQDKTIYLIIELKLTLILVPINSQVKIYDDI